MSEQVEMEEEHYKLSESDSDVAMVMMKGEIIQGKRLDCIEIYIVVTFNPQQTKRG